MMTTDQSSVCTAALVTSHIFPLTYHLPHTRYGWTATVSPPFLLLPSST
uniref:Uncharacterized protein n=1 Tax=Anguilla anguilla TaxID=7936 RepID=A0A0E9UV66_ANGAN